MEEILEKIKKEVDVFKKAKLIKYLLKEKKLKVYQLAEKLSITPAYLCHLNRLNNLPDIVVDGYYSKLITISHLFLISRVKDEDKIIKIYEKVLADNLTIRQTEELIREVIYEIKDKGNYLKTKEKQKIIEGIKNKYQKVEVKISQTRTRGSLFIEIKGNLETTSKILKELGQSFYKQSLKGQNLNEGILAKD